MHRLLVSLVAVAALAAGAVAQPRPVWSVDVGEKGKSHYVSQVSFTPDGRTLLVRYATDRPDAPLAHDTLLVGLDTATRKELFRRPLSSPWEMHAPAAPLAFLPKDRLLVASGSRVELLGARDGVTVSARPATPQELGKLPRLPEWAGAWATGDGGGYTILAHWEADGRLSRGVLPAGKDDKAGWKELGLARLERVRPKHELAAPADTRAGSVAAVGAAGTRVAFYERVDRGGGGLLTAYSLKTEGDRLHLDRVARVENPHLGWVMPLRYSPDGRVLASGSWDGTVKLWDDPRPGEMWKARATITGPGLTVCDLAFRPDGKVLAFVTYDDQKPNVWMVDVESGKPLASLQVFRAASVGFAPDGRTFATGGNQGRVDVWSVEQVLAAPKQ